MCSIDTSCGMKEWVLDKETLMQLYPLLYKDKEYGGKFTFPIDERSGIIERISSKRKIITNVGASDSVQAPMGIVNFHTHPISCYLDEKTIWGWVSGEDLRECILFGLKGSVAHVVIAVEGVYVVQLNPKVLNSLVHIQQYLYNNVDIIKEPIKESIDLIMIEYFNFFKNIDNPFHNETGEYLFNKGITTTTQLKTYLNTLDQELDDYFENNILGKNLLYTITDILRGVIIVFIEIYFRSTHKFRSNLNLKQTIYPKDFIKFTNAFKLNNIFSRGKKIKSCGKNIKCGGVPVYEKNKNCNVNFKKYVDDYEYETGFYIVDSHGATIIMPLSLIKIFNFYPLVEHFSKKYFNHSWFDLKLTPNFIKSHQRKYISPTISNTQRKKILENCLKNANECEKINCIYITTNPTFNYYPIKGTCHSSDIKNYIRTMNVKNEKTPQITIVGSPQCPYTIKAEKLLKNNRIKHKKIYFKTVREAIHKGNVDKIPAIYNFEQYLGGYEDLKKLIAAKEL